MATMYPDEWERNINQIASKLQERTDGASELQERTDGASERLV